MLQVTAENHFGLHGLKMEEARAGGSGRDGNMEQEKLIFYCKTYTFLQKLY